MARRRKYFTDEQRKEAHRSAQQRHYRKRVHGVTKSDLLSKEAGEALLCKRRLKKATGGRLKSAAGLLG